jgi:hypothetical protein
MGLKSTFTVQYRLENLERCGLVQSPQVRKRARGRTLTDTRLTREIQVLRLTFRGDRTYSIPSRRQLRALNRLFGEILTIQGKPEWFEGSATDYRREVRLEILRLITGETWILTSANLSGHVVSCLISYLKKQGACNWDV